MADTELSDAIVLMAKALSNALVSPNEADANDEPANVVDGLFAIARSLNEVAGCISMVGRVLEEKL